MPVPRVAGCGPGRPRARARMLLHPRPDRAIRAGAPRCSLRFAQGHRHPGAARPSGARGRRSEWPPAAPADRTTSPAHTSEVLLKDERPDIAHSQRQDRGLTGGWWPRPPSGRRPISPERAVPERASSACGAGALARAPQPPVRTPSLHHGLRVVGGGHSRSAPRVKRLLLRRPRGPSARIAAGRRWLRPSGFMRGRRPRGWGAGGATRDIARPQPAKRE